MKAPMKHKIILDCDPGHDDAIAILLAAHHPDIELLASTTVVGHQTVTKTANNALNVSSLLLPQGWTVLSCGPCVMHQTYTGNRV